MNKKAHWILKREMILTLDSAAWAEDKGETRLAESLLNTALKFEERLKKLEND